MEQVWSLFWWLLLSLKQDERPLAESKEGGGIGDVRREEGGSCLGHWENGWTMEMSLDHQAALIIHLKLPVLHIKWDELIWCVFFTKYFSNHEYRHRIGRVLNLMKVWDFSRWVQGKRGKGNEMSMIFSDKPWNLSFHKCLLRAWDASCWILGTERWIDMALTLREGSHSLIQCFPNVGHLNALSCYHHIFALPIVLTVFFNYVHVSILINLFEKKFLCLNTMENRFHLQEIEGNCLTQYNEKGNMTEFPN